MDPYKAVLQFVDNFMKKPVVGGMVGEKINELKQLPEKVKNLPQRFVEDYKNTLRISKLPRNAPERQAYDKKVKEMSFAMAMSAGLTSPMATGGIPPTILSKIKAKQSLTPEEMRAVSKMGINFEQLNRLAAGTPQGVKRDATALNAIYKREGIAPQLNIGAGLNQAQQSAGQKGYNAPLAGFETGLQQGQQNAQQRLLQIMGRK